MTNTDTYDLLNAADFERYAARYGRDAAKSARFMLAYTGPSTLRFAGAHTGRFSSKDPALTELQKRPKHGGTLNDFLKQEAHAIRALLDIDFSQIEQRAMAWVKSEYPPVNPAPAYCWYMSALSLSAVYKAHVASDPHYEHACWRDLSYATDNGIVFG